ncbi:MAG: hypothetical protein RMJ98_14375 [Myxococcales bacterium]|nr:hypothetical protein [Polyangiaceae bacterium]MDW8250479.1 hypothetical protein [Myxococcales bacterium]
MFTPRYLRVVLADNGAAHTLNHWGRMPSLQERLAILVSNKVEGCAP